jgi:hypothetical protein
MRKIAWVVFVVPVILSIIFGGFVLSNVLGQPDRQLNMWQFKFATPPNQEGDTDIRIVNFLNSYSISAPLNFTIRVNDTAFDCGDLYLTIYNLDTSPKQVVAQNAYFSQCFAQINATLPVHDIFSPTIGTPGTYQILAEMKDKSYQNSINVTGTFKVQ